MQKLTAVERQALETLNAGGFIKFGYVYQVQGNRWTPCFPLIRPTIEKLSRAGYLRQGYRSGPTGGVKVLEITSAGRGALR